MHEDALIPIGKIVGTHGLRGTFKIVSYAESPSSFAPGERLALRRHGKTAASFEIESAGPHRRGLILSLKGVATIDQAEEWVGFELCIEKAALPEPEDGSYYWHQIIGLAVVTVNNRRLGRVEEILPTGSNDVYVVRDGRKEVLVPALESVVTEIDLEHGTLKVDLPEGLEE